MLDNFIWHALGSTHDSMAQGGTLARRYPTDVSGFAGLAREEPEAWSELATLVNSGETVVLTLDLVEDPPANWEVTRRGSGRQMVMESLNHRPKSSVAFTPLAREHVTAMLELVELAKPGPFRARTIDFGGYLGIFDRGQLIAMAGHRMQTPSHVEISAVCTHPDAQGRGLATAMVHEVARRIMVNQQVPILHIAADNRRAQRIYERLGFTVRRNVVFTGVAKRD